MSKILIITGQFPPFTKSLGGILRIYSFLMTLKKKHKVFLLSGKCISKKNYGYLGLPKKDLMGVKINYLNNDNFKIITLLSNYKFLRNLFYILGFDYALNINNKYFDEVCKIIKINKIKYVIISSPPFSLFYLVKRIKKKFKNIKIILDYRDGWSTRISNKFFYPIIFLIKNCVEKKILSYSNFVIAATANINQNLNSLSDTKTKLIRNGFLYKPKAKKKINKKIKIGYFGLISEDFSSYRNIRVIYDVIARNEILQKKLIFEFYGNNEIKNNDIKNFKSFKFKKNLSLKKALTKMTEMDFLLILHTEKSTAREMVTSKFYDYLASRTQIINICSGKNEVGNIIKKHKLGYNLNYQSDDIENFFINLNKNNKKIKWNEKLNFFSRKYQNKKLLQIIEK